jgi:hypothetical protein
VNTHLPDSAHGKVELTRWHSSALKEQGAPVRMLVLPRRPHGPTEPKMLLLAMQANLEWFDRYLLESTGEN